MTSAKADIIAKLRKDILPFQGFNGQNNAAVDRLLGPVKNVFPGRVFPIAAIHEFTAATPEDAAATNGFVAAILGALTSKGGSAIWVGASPMIFPPALKAFGINPEKIIFIRLQKEQQIAWTIEEALKCKSVTAVVGELSTFSFTTSRRLQLAVEESKVTGFILRGNVKSLNTTAVVSRWKITALPSFLPGDLPGVGFPRWNVNLLKVRNGLPGSWELEFAAGRLKQISNLAAIMPELQKKTG